MMTMVILPFMAAVTLVWLLSVARKDASIVDRFWGLFFVSLSGLYYLQAPEIHWRLTLITALVGLWGGRLALHIHSRNRGHGEDVRYARMRQRRTKSFWWYSLFAIFWLQGGLALVISAPIGWLMVHSPQPGFSQWDLVGILLFTVGLVFEAGGDHQLKKFKQNPENKGKVMDKGLWSLTRHPNYFGDSLIWWGFFAFALNTPWGIWTVVGPLLMTYFLRYVTGVTLLEKDMIRNKPGYAEYAEKTPAFFPKLW